MDEVKEIENQNGNGTSTRYLAADRLASMAGVPEEDFFIPEFDSFVRLRGLTKQEQMDLRREAVVGETIDEEKLQLLMVQKGLLNPKIEVNDVGQLAKWPAGIFDRLVLVISRLSGADEEAAKAARKSVSPR